MESESLSKPWRRRTAWVALVLGCIALLAANSALFLRAFVFDGDTFTDAVAPDQPDERVINGVANTLSDRILDSAQIQQRIQDLTPDDSPLVAGAVDSAADDVIQAVVRQVLNSSAFRTVWRDAVERAHTTFVNMVEDDDRQPVVLNLTNLVSQVDQRLEARGIDLFDSTTIQDIGEVVAVRRDQIAEVREGLDLLRRGSIAIAVAAVILLVGAVVLATDRRRMLVRIGIGAAIAMVVTAVALRIGRWVLLDRIEIDTRRAAVQSLWGRVFSTLIQQAVVILVLGLVLAAGAWLVGSSPRATALRDKVRSLRRVHPARVTSDHP